MTALVEKYIELPFEYSSDEEALEYIETLMMLGDWQAVCDVIRQDSSGALVDCPDGVPALYFDDEMQVVLFKVVTSSDLSVDVELPKLNDEGGVDVEETPVSGTVTVTKVRAASYLPERDDDA